MNLRKITNSRASINSRFSSWFHSWWKLFHDWLISLQLKNHKPKTKIEIFSKIEITFDWQNSQKSITYQIDPCFTMDLQVKLQLNWTIEWKYWKKFSFVFSLFCLQKILWNLNWVRYTQFYFRLESGTYYLPTLQILQL